ncbi:MAG: sulfurtransferase TusA family protein [Pseudomonadales bacterium]
MTEPEQNNNERFFQQNDTVLVDACGLDCPMPLLKAKQALNKLAAGEFLRVLATDPGSHRDFHVFAEQSGQRLVSATQDKGRFEFVFEKTSLAEPS